jgi:hypothetical protein
MNSNKSKIARDLAKEESFTDFIPISPFLTISGRISFRYDPSIVAGF